jgi:cysteine desulfurase
VNESSEPIYLDYQATTPLDPRVLEAMLPYFTKVFGNPASKSHSYGNDAFSAVEKSRAVIAKSINAKPQEIIFTSGATESINLAIKGAAIANQNRGRHFIAAATEHKAVLDCYGWLARNNFETTILAVDSDGFLDLQQLSRAIRDDTVMVAVMAANNEIGVLQQIEEVGALCRERGAHFMTDATQALGKVPIDVQRMNIDLLAASGHKVYGPKGTGFLYARRSNPRVSLEAHIHGGGHEKGLRSGTLATANIVGMAVAVQLAIQEMDTECSRLLQLRNQLLDIILKGIPNSRLNGSSRNRLAGNLNVLLPGIQSEALMIALRNEVAIASGSACTTAAVLPSHVLMAIGLTESDAHSSVRVGLGRFTTLDQVERAGAAICREAARLAALA